MDLKTQLKSVFGENDKLLLHVRKLEVKRREIDKQTDEIMAKYESEKGKTSSFQVDLNKNKFPAFKNEDIPDYHI